MYHLQFVVWDPSIQKNQDDSADVQLQNLKLKRDGAEAKRLDKIRHEGLHKIFLEEELLNRFCDEICNEAKSVIEKRSNEKLFIKEAESDKNFIQLQTDFLTNQWALWLNKVTSDISRCHVNGKEEVLSKFETFKRESLSKCRVLNLLNFATSPSDLMTLGRYLEAVELKNDAVMCYEKVVQNEEHFCETALISLVRLRLQKTGKRQDKIWAKKTLKKAKIKIQEKIETLLSANEVVKLTAKAAHNAGAAKFHNRFEEQVTNLVGAYQIHSASIDDILGRTLHSAISGRFTGEGEAQEIDKLITESSNICKPLRISKKAFIKGDDLYLTSNGKEIQLDWLPVFTYCKSDIAKCLKIKIEKTDYNIAGKTLFKDKVVTQDDLWTLLKQQGFIEMETTREILRIDAKDKLMCEITLTQEIGHCRSMLVDFLTSHNGQVFSPQTSLEDFGLTEEQAEALVQTLRDCKILLAEKSFEGKLAKLVKEETLVCLN